MELYLCYWCAIFIYLPIVSAFSQGIFRRKQRPPIDGGWSSWQSWSSCYKNVKNDTRNKFFPPWENFDIQSRNRTCSLPKPLFGGKDCEPPSHRFRQCSCMNPLLGRNRIKDNFISASSNLDGYPASEVRFSNTTVGWCAKTKGSFWTETYLQINFQNFTNVKAISTIDNRKGRVTRYKLKYSLNGRVWSYIRKDDKNLVFSGNYFHAKRKKNNFSSHVMKYLRVIPVQTFGLPCFKIEVYGCVFTCGSKLSAPYGELVAQSSETYDQNCLWRVEVLNTTSLTFVFSIFYVSCKNGYIDFHSGESSFTNAPLLRRICLQDEDVSIPNLTLNQNSLWIRFVSNSSDNGVSFNIKYLAKCSQTIFLVKGEPVVIKSPNYPNDYFGNLNCSWTVMPPSPLKKIDIDVNDFNVESSGSSNTCADDFVVIDVENYGGVKKKYDSYCNNKKPQERISISADKVIISFKSDALLNSKGFSFTLLSGQKDISPTVSAGWTNNPVLGTAGHNSKINSGGEMPNSTPTRKVDEPKDDTWTVIIICTFSALVLVLIATVLYLNCRRFINNRNELSAHCAKAAEENRQMKKKKQKDSLIREKNVLITPPSSPSKTLDKESPEHFALLAENEGNTEEISKPVETNGHIKRVHSEIDVHNEMNQSPDQVDGCGEVISSSTSSQLSSPAKDMVINCELLSNEEAEESVI